jgi:hypothetical protein
MTQAKLALVSDPLSSYAHAIYGFTCGWRIVISPMIPQDFPSLLRFCEGNLLVLFTIERLSYDQALHASSHACELLIAKEMVGASGFEPPSSWPRTSLDQAKPEDAGFQDSRIRNAEKDVVADSSERKHGLQLASDG